MLKIHKKQHIRCATVETPTAWFVVAVLLETRGSETVAISEPKVIKVIPKKQLALNGSCASSRFLLQSSAQVLTQPLLNILSPYVPNFGYAQSHIISWFAAQPPTV